MWSRFDDLKKEGFVKLQQKVFFVFSGHTKCKYIERKKVFYLVLKPLENKVAVI